MIGHWNGCPTCKDCPDRAPYSKCRETCVAYCEWKVKHDAMKKVEEDRKRVSAAISDHRERMIVKARKVRRDKMR